MARSRTRTVVVLAGCAIYLCGLGWIDRVTGYELGLFTFYTAPVAVVAWHLGRGPGVLVAFIASVVWYLADRAAGDRYSVPFYGYWNTAMHFSSFIVNAIAFAKIKASLDHLHELQRALAEARNELERLTGLLSAAGLSPKPPISESPGPDAKGPGAGQDWVPGDSHPGPRPVRPGRD